MEPSFSAPIVAPSLLSADFGDIATALALVQSARAPWLHLDVMDGHFVPNLTFGPKMIADIRKRSSLVLDTHLMIERPEDSWEAYADAGSNWITFHLEAVVHAHRLVHAIKARGCKAGISIVPSTPVAALEELLGDLDLVLVMSVNPGFGGQELIPRTLDKIRQLRELRERHGYGFRISVDGGVNNRTRDAVLTAGPDVVVAGNAFFTAPDPAGFVKSFAVTVKG